MDDEKRQRAKLAGEEFAKAMLTPDPRYIDWRMPNFLTFCLFGFILIALQLDPEIVYLGHLSGNFVSSMIGALVGQSIWWITNVYGSRIDQFEPLTVLDAKRANEQIKSLATAINGVAAGGAIAVVVKQLSETSPSYSLIVFTIAVAYWVHTGARRLLGRLKDEQPI